MSRSTRFLQGLVFGYGYQLVVIGVGFWLTPFLLSHLGSKTYGLWLIAMQVLMYLTLLDLGVLALVPRDTAAASGMPDGGRNTTLHGVVAVSSRLTLLQIPLVAGVAFACWWWLPREWEPWRDVIGVLLGIYTLLFPCRLFQGFLEGLQEAAFLGSLRMAAWAAGTATTAGLVLAGWSLTAMFLGWLTTALLITFASGLKLAFHHSEVFAGWWGHATRADLWAQLRRSAWTTLSQLTQGLIAGADLLLIGKLAGPEAVVVYSCTCKLGSVLSNQPQMLMQAAVPGLSQLRTGADPVRTLQITTALMQAMLLLTGAIAILMLGINQAFVVRWLGAERFGGLFLTVMLAVHLLVRHLTTALSYTVFTFGYERRLALTGLADGVTACALMYLLLPKLGLPAAPFALIGGAFISLTANVVVLVTCCGVTLLALVQPLLPLLVRLALSATVMTVAAPHIPPTWPAVATAIAGIGVFYTLLMLPIVRRSLLWPYVETRLRWLPGGLRRRLAFS